MLFFLMPLQMRLFSQFSPKIVHCLYRETKLTFVCQWLYIQQPCLISLFFWHILCVYMKYNIYEYICIYMIISADRNNFLLTLSALAAFYLILFAFWLGLSIFISNRHDEKGHTCIAVDFWGQTFSFPLLRVTLAFCVWPL